MATEGVMLRDSTHIVTTSLNTTASYGVGGSGQFLLVTHSTSAGGDNVITLSSTSSKSFFGVLQNKPAANQAADVAIAGISKVVAASTIAVGDLLVPDPYGRAIPIGTNNSTAAIVGQAMTASAGVDQIIPMLLFTGGRTSV